MDPQPDKLVAVCAYKVGALEVKRRLEGRVLVNRTRVVCRKCRKDLRANNQPEVPDDAELAADAPPEYA